MCVICKQARRSGRPWAGMVPGDPYWTPGGAPETRSAAGPPPRLGKRAFVRAVPQLAGNLRLRMVRTPLFCSCSFILSPVHPGKCSISWSCIWCAPPLLQLLTHLVTCGSRIFQHPLSPPKCGFLTFHLLE